MNKLTLVTLSLLFSSSLFSQNYWQQEVNYKINVTLDDAKHQITAFEEFEYVNNSPAILDFIYIHVWPNAYKNEHSALGKQQWQENKTVLKYGADSLKGSIDNLDFRVNGEKVIWEFDPVNLDICKIFLATPLFSGGRITISTPFTVQIPSGEISRLGHVGQSYQITQWYPKPAVYDKNGWNPIPYLNQGEFYSEYGSFDVTITLPENYVVGATGDLQTTSEIDFLNDLAAKSALKIKSGELGSGSKQVTSFLFPESSSKMKTIRYTQRDVHDFGWFADKRFEVLKGEVELPQSKRKVTTWAMFTPKNAEFWKNAIEYINDGTYYYSLWNGDYPYNQVTAVDGTISAGGGMEYPNVTVIGNTSSKEELEVVIVHEVGHNWFYGILGSNERVHGWMDEGMNTLNEVRYVQTKYPENTRFSDMVLNGRFHLNGLNHHDSGDISYRMMAMIGADQPIETPSPDFTPINYGIIMYQKTGLVFFYLRAYLGEELFGKCMHAYFEKWKFKHPQPEDMRSILEQTSGKNLSWLFDDLIQTTHHIDYRLSKVKKTASGFDVTVRNVGQVNGPVEIDGYADGKLIEKSWVEPGDKKQLVHLNSLNLDEVRIDANNNIPEIDRNNNQWKKSLLFNKIEPVKFEFLFGDHERGKSNNFWTPMVSGNAYDKFMVGIVAHNYGIPFKNFQYLMAPMYSTGRKSISGIGEFSYSMLPRKSFKLIRIGVSLKSFKNDEKMGIGFTDQNQYYANFSPYIFMNLGNRKSALPISHSFLIQTISSTIKSGSNSTNEMGGFVKFATHYLKADHQADLILRSDYMKNTGNSNEVGRVSIEGNYRFRYLKNKMKRWVELRAYFGSNYRYKDADNTGRYLISMSGVNGNQDIFYEDYYFARSATSGFFANQRNADMGGFKTTSNAASTSFWMTTGNFYLQLPIKPNVLGVFADAGAYSNGSATNGIFVTGLGMRLGKVFGVYFPLYQSDNMGALFTSNYSKNIRFTLKMNIVNKGLKLTGIN